MKNIIEVILATLGDDNRQCVVEAIDVVPCVLTQDSFLAISLRQHTPVGGHNHTQAWDAESTGQQGWADSTRMRLPETSKAGRDAINNQILQTRPEWVQVA